jgi:hypothetical protein
MSDPLQDFERRIAQILEAQKQQTAEMLAEHDRMAAEMEEARVVNREAIYRVVVLAAAIVGFSATLLSLEGVDLSIDESLLRVSWLLLALVVGLGPLSIYLESRAKYAITWRAMQAQEFDQPGPSLVERLKLLGVVLYTVLIRPRNLIFVRDTDVDDPRKAWLNGRIIQNLHVVWDLALALELLFWVAFVAALIFLLAAVHI